MASDDIKLNLDKGSVNDSGEHETIFDHHEDGERAKFLPDHADPERQEDGATGKKKSAGADFQGLSREELEQYASDPKWVKIRWILFIVFVVAWVAMLVIAIVIVVLTPKCPPSPDLEWYEEGVAYAVDTAHFQDSDGDGVGDLNGVLSRLEHFTNLTVMTVVLPDLVNATDMKNPKNVFGQRDQFVNLTKAFKKKGLRVVIGLDLSGETVDEDAPGSYDEVLRSWASGGAEGFILSLPTGSSNATYSAYAKHMQDVLDMEFNKKDDRSRVIISPKTELEVDVRAQMFNPFESRCSSGAMLGGAGCNATALRQLEQTDVWQNPWKMMKVVPTSTKCPVCNMALRLLLPGAPLMDAGQEIGVSLNSEIKWDDTATGGFTSDANYQAANSVNSVLAQKAAGFDGVSFYNLFKSLGELRKTEPSLRWGEFQLLDFGHDDTISFKRAAEGFDPIVFVANTGEGVADSIAFTVTEKNKKGKVKKEDKFSQAKVLVVSGVDITVGETIDANAVYVPPGAVLVAKLINPEV